MTDPHDIAEQNPRPGARWLAYSMVVLIPALSFLLLCHVGYGAGTMRLHGVQELMDTPTNEEIMLPDFSMLARLVHGYAAAPGYGMTERRFGEFESSGGAYDVLVFGSSHAYRGFDPRVFAAHGQRLFNLGSTGQTPLATRFLLDDLGEHLDAKLAIIEVTPFQLQSGSESALTARDLALNRPPSWSAVRMALRTRDFDTTRLVASYMIAPRPRLTEVPGGAPLDVATYCWYVPGGYCEWGSTGNPKQQFPSFDFAPSDDALVDLRDVVATLRVRGTSVAFVIAPIPRQTVQAARNFEAGNATVAALAAELEVPLLDFTQPRWLDELELAHPAHYYDGDHLNQAGVTIFNEHLAAELISRGLL